MALLTGDAFMALFTDYREAFRAELRGSYDVDSDRDDFQRWVNGATTPNPERIAALRDELVAELADGRRAYRVKVMFRSQHNIMAADWDYPVTVAAGEDVRVLDVYDQPLPKAALGLEDFWVIDGRVVVMHYSVTGKFLGAGDVLRGDVPRYLDARDALVAAAVPFQQWKASHLDLFERRQAA